MTTHVPYHFHRSAYIHTRRGLGRWVEVVQRNLSYRFELHQSPRAGDLVQRLISDGIPSLQAADTEIGPESFFAAGYQPTPLVAKRAPLVSSKSTVTSANRLTDTTRLEIPGVHGGRYLRDADGTWFRIVTNDATSFQLAASGAAPKAGEYSVATEPFFDPYPARRIDFDRSAPYRTYHFELFFHFPLTVAIHLSRNGRYEDARRWFHYIFDPTDSSDGPSPERFWRFKPFQQSDAKGIEAELLNLATGADPEWQQRTAQYIKDWQEHPFRPHLVARNRPVAYMLKTVMAYLDNLIAWGDSLFRQDTREAINDALQLYILATGLLGPRPEEVPRKGRLAPATYDSLRKNLDAMSNALRDVELDIPFDILPLPTGTSDATELGVAQALGRSLYFCIPRNDRLLGYWDTVADRLYKIRNSLNIEGVFRQLPLFPPPIDPALLAAAAAAGLDVAAIAAGAQQPLPLVRFTVLLQKATELCQEVKSLGSQLLAALEKEDGERLSLLRAGHERAVLEIGEAVKYGQWQEARKARQGLDRSFANAVQRYRYYERLLGRNAADIVVPGLEEIDVKALLEDLSLSVDEPTAASRDAAIDVVAAPDGSKAKLSSHEASELRQLREARDRQVAAGTLDALAALISFVPDFSMNVQPLGVGMSTSLGGSTFSKIPASHASKERRDSEGKTYEASQSSKAGGYSRREQDWALQSNLAVGEINAVYRQLRGSQIREAVAEREWGNHKRQIENAREVEAFLRDDPKGKITNLAFYTWMKGEVRGLYTRAFDLAFEVAKKAERALQHELGDPSLRFLTNTYAGAGHQGLLSGERLYADLKRMEVGYLDKNRRELELTKHVSLRSLDPQALLELRGRGSCTLKLPESLFDMDCPGHYFRRIKAIALTLPCVTGPYASVSCRLTLQKSTIRKSASLAAGKYRRDGEDSARFSDYYGCLDSIVTSSGNNDAGMFETNLRDERRLPFEGHGAECELSLQLLPPVPQFDYDTISDVVIHLRYTARDGGALLADTASKELKTEIEKANAVGLSQVFSLRHQFPSEWAEFKAATASDEGRAQLKLQLTRDHYPFWSALIAEPKVRSAALYARSAVTVFAASSGEVGDTLTDTQETRGFFRAELREETRAVALPAPVGELSLFFADNSLSDLWLVVTWGK